MLGQWKIIAGVSAAMTVVHVVDLFLGGFLKSFGIQPREISSAYTIATAPWLHADFMHLGSNLAAFVVLGSLALLNGVRPNSVVHTTKVSSSRPRDFKSRNKPAMA